MALFGFGKKEGAKGPTPGPPPAPPGAPPVPPGPPTAKKAPTGPPPEEQGIPVDQVISMRQQGLTNNQVIQNLQRAGYSQQQIFDAMNQADIKGGVEASPPSYGEEAPANPMQPPTSGPPAPSQPPPPPSGPPPQGPPSGPPTGPPPGPPPQPQRPSQSAGSLSSTEEQIEQIAESIIDEKWTELVTNINKIISWKDKLESRMDAFDQKIDDLKADYDKLHEAVLGKIEQYDKNITNVGTEVKAMEKVFQKVLPAFQENINELGRVTKRLKGSK
ncbi:hypothetical protein GF351_06395 [Candidatus Woesearchaeota archaeon]|nr:hypothetical protein [Candidatus Woesearchaeota archaeon]